MLHYMQCTRIHVVSGMNCLHADDLGKIINSTSQAPSSGFGFSGCMATRTSSSYLNGGKTRLPLARTTLRPWRLCVMIWSSWYHSTTGRGSPEATQSSRSPLLLEKTASLGGSKLNSGPDSSDSMGKGSNTKELLSAEGSTPAIMMNEQQLMVFFVFDHGCCFSYLVTMHWFKNCKMLRLYETLYF